MTSAKVLADDVLTVVAYDDEYFGLNGESFYYLSLPRWEWENRFDECPMVYSVTRQQTPLARVKQCG